MAAAQGKASREALPTQEARGRRKETHKAQHSAQSTAAAEQGKGFPKERRVSFAADAMGRTSGTPSAEVSSRQQQTPPAQCPALANTASSLASSDAAQTPCSVMSLFCSCPFWSSTSRMSAVLSSLPGFTICSTGVSNAITPRA